MELTPEFKQTEIGSVPFDWHVVPLGEVTRLDVGFAFKSIWFRSFGDVRLLRGENVGYGRPTWSDARWLAAEDAQGFSAYRLEPGDIVIGMDRTFTKSGAKVSILSACDCPSLLVQRVGRFVPKRCNRQFLWALLCSPRFQATLQAQQKGMDIPHLSRSEILEPLVAFPPTRKEQGAIAEALSNADALIESLEQFIAKKRLIKQGVMQELLTGKRRLPGFETQLGFKQTEVGPIPNDWNLPPIGRLLGFKNGLNKAKQYFGYGTPIVNYMDVYSRSGIRLTDLAGKVSVTPDEQRNYSARRGDVFFTRTSETVEEIGTAAVLLEDISGAVFSGFVLRGRPHSDTIDTGFSKYCFASSVVRRQIVSTASYTTRALTNGRLLSKVLLPLPSRVDEQAAIATVLSDIDMELESLQAQEAKARLLKQGMMQELLTGRIRLT